MMNRQQLRPDRSNTTGTASPSTVDQHASKSDILNPVKDLNELLNLAMTGMKSYISMIVLLRTREEKYKLTTRESREQKSLQNIAMMLQDVAQGIVVSSTVVAQTDATKFCWTVPSYRALMDASKIILKPLSRVHEHYSKFIGRGTTSELNNDFDLLNRAVIQLEGGSDELPSWTDCVRDVFYVVAHRNEDGEYVP